MRVEVAHRCSAPPEAVWEWIADPHRHIRMLPDSVRAARVLEDGDMEAELHAGGVTELMRVRITAADPPSRLEEQRVDGVREGRTVFTLQPDGDGTLVTLVSEVELPRLLAGFAKPLVTRSLTDQLENLDRLSAAG